MAKKPTPWEVKTIPRNCIYFSRRNAAPFLEHSGFALFGHTQRGKWYLCPKGEKAARKLGIPEATIQKAKFTLQGEIAKTN